MQVTAASEAVYGFERRDGFIRAQAENRELMPKISSKKSQDAADFNVINIYVSVSYIFVPMSF